MTCYVYMMRCRDNSLYTGWTNDLAHRVREHVAGRGAKYTRAKEAVGLAYYEEVEDRSAALRREYALKQLPKAEKELLAEEARERVAEFQKKHCLTQI